MKKSFLMMLAALLLASCGDGRPFVDLFPERDGCISYVCDAPFEGDTVWLHYHVPAEGDIASLPVQIVIPGMLRDGERYRNDWIAKADEYMASLSDGERQKAMIARALAQQTPIIILDEPTAFLDVASRIETMRLLQNLAHDRGKAVLLSSHDISQSLMLADELWLITTDRQVLTGTTRQLVDEGAMNRLFENREIHFNPQILDYSF